MVGKVKSREPQSLVLKPSEIKVALKHLEECQRPAFIWGPPGIGKSQILKQNAKEGGYQFVDIRLSQMDPTDLRGIAIPSKDSQGRAIAEWSPPSFLNRDPSVKTFYLFDELNVAPQSIQAIAYQFVLDRQVGDFKLMPNDVVFAAGNRETDRGATFKMPTPLMNRFVHLEMKHDFNDWFYWAIENYLNKNVVGYLSSTGKSHLMEFDPKSASKGFATPRTWEFVAQIIDNDPDVPRHIMTAMVAGAIGQGHAIEFMEYCEHANKLPAPLDILEGRVTNLDSQETSIMYALTTGLCYELSLSYNELKTLKGTERDNARKKWDKMVDNYFGYMLKNFMPEMCILGSRIALSNYRLPVNISNMPNWKAFSDQYKEVILRA